MKNRILPDDTKNDVNSFKSNKQFNDFCEKSWRLLYCKVYED